MVVCSAERRKQDTPRTLYWTTVKGVVYLSLEPWEFPELQPAEVKRKSTSAAHVMMLASQRQAIAWAEDFVLAAMQQ